LPADIHSKSDIKPAGLKKYYQNGLLDPVRFDVTFLDEQRKKLGEYGFACQYDQSPIPRGQSCFDTSKIRCKNAPP
jgi:hypothetical protein